MTRNRAELLWSERELTTKWRNNLGLSSCAVPRSAVVCVVAYFRRTELLPGVFGEEWYRLIGVRIEQGEDINDFNLQTKKLGCNYWSTYTKSGIGGVQVTSLHCDPIGVDNRSFRSKKLVII